MSIVRVQGCCLEIELQGPDGIIECIIQRVVYYGQPAFEVDLWRGMPFMAGTITAFRAGVFMKWNGERYRIIEPKRYIDCNQFWSDLEYTIGCHIAVND